MTDVCSLGRTFTSNPRLILHLTAVSSLDACEAPQHRSGFPHYPFSYRLDRPQEVLVLAKPNLTVCNDGVHLPTTTSPGALVARRYTAEIALCVLAAVVISLMISAHYLPAVLDDALISYRYSERLLHGHGLTWNDGEFVEGYSNLLWVLLVAAAGLVLPDLMLAGWIMGALANTATILAIAWTFGRRSASWPIALTSSLVAVACSEAFAFSAVNGLETALAGALLAWALATAYRMPPHPSGRDRLAPSLLFGLLAITRADGALFGVSVALAELVRNGINRVSIKTAIAFSGTPLAFFALQIVFRLTYYDSLMPNAASAKLAFNAERILGGLSYVGRGAFVNATVLMAILIVAAMLFRARGRGALRQSALFIIPGIAWLTYVCLIGGDIFPFDRHWLPAFICAVFALGGLLARLPPIRTSRIYAVVGILALAHIAVQSSINPYLVQFHQLDGHLKELRRELHRVDPTGKLELEFFTPPPQPTRSESREDFHKSVRECGSIGSMLRSAFGTEQPVIAVNAAGCLPYHTGFPSIDMLGLTDSHIAHNRPLDFGEGLIGHELGDGEYVLSRKPDLIVFCGMGSIRPGVDIPCFRGDREIYVAADFKRNYRLVHYRVNDYDLGFWTRIDDGRIGIIRNRDQIEIPGFLLATTTEASVTIDDAGRVVASLRIGDARVSDIHFPPGTWEISLYAGGPDNLRLATLPDTGSQTLTPHLLRVTSNGEPRSFTVSGGPGLIYAIRAKKL